MITVDNYKDYESYLQLELLKDQENAFHLWTKWIEHLIYLGQFDLGKKLLGFIKKNKVAKHNVPVIYYSEGILNYEAGFKEKAVKAYNKALEEYHNIGTYELDGTILSAIGEIHFLSGNYSLAEQFFQQAVSCDMTPESKLKMGFSLFHLGILFSKQKKEIEAIKTLKKAYEIFDNAKNMLYIGLTALEIGKININSGKTEKGLRFYEKARDIFIAINDETGIALSLYNYGLYFLKTGQLMLAEIGCREALGLYIKNGDLKRSYLVFSCLGTISARQKKYIEAENLFFQALHGYEDIEDKEGILSVYKNLVALYKEQNNLQLACKYEEKMKELS